MESTGRLAAKWLYSKEMLGWPSGTTFATGAQLSPHEQTAANATTNISGSIRYETGLGWVYGFRCVLKKQTMGGARPAPTACGPSPLRSSPSPRPASGRLLGRAQRLARAAAAPYVGLAPDRNLVSRVQFGEFLKGNRVPAGIGSVYRRTHGDHPRAREGGVRTLIDRRLQARGARDAVWASPIASTTRAAGPVQESAATIATTGLPPERSSASGVRTVASKSSACRSCRAERLSASGSKTPWGWHASRRRRGRWGGNSVWRPVRFRPSTCWRRSQGAFVSHRRAAGVWQPGVLYCTRTTVGDRSDSLRWLSIVARIPILQRWSPATSS